MNEDNTGCRSVLAMTLLTLIAIVLLLAIGAVAAPLP